jgi:hypothetical protein
MKTALIAPRALDALALPADLDGRDGTNRAHGHVQIAALDDLDAVRAWLARVADGKTTFENYRKEAERLIRCRHSARTSSTVPRIPEIPTAARALGRRRWTQISAPRPELATVL